MGFWQTLFTSFGGTTAVLLICGFLGRSLIAHWFDRRLATAKAELQRSVFEHQIRFSKLYDKTLSTLDKTFTRLRLLHLAVKSYIADFEGEGEGKPQKRDEIRKCSNSFVKAFFYHEIYLPGELCEKIRQLFGILGSVERVYTRGNRLNRHDMPAASDSWDEAIEQFDKEAEPLFAEIRLAFRNIVDVAARAAVKSADATDLSPAR